MSLPARTTLEDIDTVCGYLLTKPTGATLAEARAVVDQKFLDARRLTALKDWGLIEDADNKVRITELGRQAVRNSGAFRSEVLQSVVRKVPPYAAVVERAAHRLDASVAATEVAAHWYQHFKGSVSSNDRVLNEQAICFFQLAEGADLGTLKIGRRGLPTRFEFDTNAIRAFISVAPPIDKREEDFTSEWIEESDSDSLERQSARESEEDASDLSRRGNRVFITHGKDTKILGQVKEIVQFGKFEPVVAMEHETAAKPVPKKVMDDMRTCDAAVIHVSAENVLYDDAGNEVRQVNENVLIEIGAAMALYGDRFVLLVEEGVNLPSNLQGLYECRYKGSELDMPATMKLLKAFNEF